MSVNPIDDINVNNVLINTAVNEEIDAVRDAPPVEPVEASSASSPAQPIGVADEGDTTAEDLAEISREARTLATGAIRDGTLDEVAVEQDVNQPSESIRELLESFEEYDNSAARETFNNYLNMFTRYSMTPEEAANEETAEITLRALENSVYRHYGVTHFTNVTREIREGMGRAIDRWFAGEGVFMPEMLHFTSADGFVFSPLTEAALQALRAYEVRSSYERDIIARYLREMAALTPNDFLFFDPTGLGALSLARRREFLALMDGILAADDFAYRAADLRYAFANDGHLDFSLSEREMDEEKRRMADYIAYQLDTYAGQLRESVRNYGAGIVSASLA